MCAGTICSSFFGRYEDLPAAFFLTEKILLLLLEVHDLRTQLFGGHFVGANTFSYGSSGGGGRLMTGGGRHALGNNRRARGIACAEEAAALEPNATETSGAGTCSTFVSPGLSSNVAGVRLRVPLLSRPVHTDSMSRASGSASNASATGGWMQSRKISATGMT